MAKKRAEKIVLPEKIEGVPTHCWTSITFGETELPVIWCHPTKRKPGTPDGIPLAFSSVREMEELVDTLRGALRVAKIKEEK